MADLSGKMEATRSSLRKVAPAVAVPLSGVLLFLSFPPFEISFCGWIALVPLFLVCAGAAPRRAVLLGWLTGVVFFLCSLYWLHHVSWLGTVGLAFCCAVYFIPFALFVSLRQDGWRSTNSLKNVVWMLGAAAVWAASEYLRAILFTGFPWNMLAVSQYRELAFIQVAEWGGVYLISAVMVFLNTATAITILQYAHGLRRRYRMHTEMLIALLLTASVWSFGMHTLLKKPAPGQTPVRVALVQPNIPEVGNWETADPELVYERLERLTKLVQRMPDIDLIIWPETALPGLVRYSDRSADLVKRMVASGVPLLAGSMDVTWHDDNTADYYNASMLFNPRGELLGTYYKQHLVIFGEYIPFDGQFSWINALTPVNASFTPGRGAKLFKIPGDDRGFSVLICFEDSLPYLARNAARGGATWLVNQTNDSWFDPDSGSSQHLANAVFRCIETRLPMVRCANTGMTCSIDPFGRITQTLAPRTEGFQVAEMIPAASGRALTFYARFGDLFAQACLTADVAVLITLFMKRRKSDSCLKN